MIYRNINGQYAKEKKIYIRKHIFACFRERERENQHDILAMSNGWKLRMRTIAQVCTFVDWIWSALSTPPPPPPPPNLWSIHIINYYNHFFPIESRAHIYLQNEQQLQVDTSCYLVILLETRNDKLPIFRLLYKCDVCMGTI